MLKLRLKWFKNLQKLSNDLILFKTDIIKQQMGDFDELRKIRVVFKAFNSVLI